MKYELESLKDLIDECKFDACQGIIEVIMPLLEEKGFTPEDFLQGLAGYFHNRNYEQVTLHLEQAAIALRPRVRPPHKIDSESDRTA